MVLLLLAGLLLMLPSLGRPLMVAVTGRVHATSTTGTGRVVVVVIVVHVVEMAQLVTHHHFGLVSHHAGRVGEPFKVRVDGQEIAAGRTAGTGAGRIEIIADGRRRRRLMMLCRLTLVDATERVGRHDRPVSIKLLKCFTDWNGS